MTQRVPEGVEIDFTGPIITPEPESGNGKGSDSDWPVVQPLVSELPPVEPFNLNLLPSSFRALVEDTSERMQVPPDFAAAASIIALAGCVNRRAIVQPKQRDTSWREPLNLWGCCIGRPGFMKSPVARAMMRPVAMIEKLWRECFEAECKEREIEVEKARLRHSVWSEQYKRAMKEPDYKITVQPDETLGEVPERRLVVVDATAEKLLEILVENPAGVLTVRDELVGWLGEMERPGREAERGFYLQAWAGLEGFTQDRIARGTVHADHVCISLFGNIQPSRLRYYLADTLKEGSRADGLIQRFQVSVWPDCLPDWRFVDRLPDVRAAETVEGVLNALVKMTPEMPAILRFSPEAQELFEAWLTELERKIRTDRGLHPALVSHFSKYRGLMPRLAALFELADRAAACENVEGSQVLITIEHAIQAADLVEYLGSHATRIYSCITSPAMAAAHELTRHLQASALPDPFTTRQLYLKGWTRLGTPDEAREALEILEDAGWVRRQSFQIGVQGGRPREQWDINPGVIRGR